MLHSIGEGFVAVDDHGCLALVNDEAVRLLGVPPGSEGRPAAEVLDAGILEVLAAAPGESRLVLVGERILVAQRSDAIVDGARVGTVLICRDRTELHTVLRDLDGVRDLTSALRAQAHEFANVMHTVSGLIELGHPGEAVEFISRSGYGGALTDNTLVPGVTDPAVTALLMAKRSTARERAVALVVDPESACGPDGSSDVVTVLGNLIDNAVEAAGSGGTVSVALRTGAAGEGTVTTIVVEDDGPGVAEEDRERIFTSGYTTSNTAARGIGLALVDRIARRRGGRASVESAASGGARFEVRLPAPLLEGSGAGR